MADAQKNVPLVVDLDGTLIRTDMTWELLSRLLRRNPLAIFQVLFWLTRGRARLKQKLAERVQINPAALPYHEKFLAWLRAEKASGRIIILATASDLKMAQPVAAHVGLFDEVLASDGQTNLRSENKLRALTKKFGERGFDYAGNLIRTLAADTTIPMAIALDHGKTPVSVMRAVKAGFNHVMIDYAHEPIEQNARGTQDIINLVRPLGISVEAEVGNIIKSSDASGQRAATVSVAEAKEFTSKVDVDLLAVAVGTTHGIFKEQHGIDFGMITQLRSAVKPPLVLHGTCGVSMADISRSVKAGMTKINFGEGLRMNYIRYFNEFTQTLNHEHHVWRIARAAKDRLKEDIKEIIRAVGSEGKAAAIK